uniref:DNA replication factor Cdt1 C-terminal domain-containing protein n=1 Tax=Ditylenchus dipsaci TaxID=166011 RepID=A0A915EB90_9BILA
MPKVDVVLRTMRDYLEAASDDEQVKKSKKPSSRGNSQFLKEIKQSPKTPVVEHGDQTLLERIRSKENALKSAKKNPDAEKRIAILQLLKKSMVEVICSHFGLKNVSGMNLIQLMPLVVLSCGQMNKKKFIEHIDVLCEVAPKLCSKDSFLGTTCLKLAEVRADKILECIDEELKKSQEEQLLYN